MKRLFAFTDDRSRARCLDDNGGTKLIQNSVDGCNALRRLQVVQVGHNVVECACTPRKHASYPVPLLHCHETILY